MADDARFHEQFSRLTNSLQTALLLVHERARRAAGEQLEAAELVQAVRAAADAARELRPGDGEQS